MIKIKTTGAYERSLENVFRQHPHLKKEIRKAIKLFHNNPEDTRLRNHPLRRQLDGKHAFSIDADIRVIYEWIGKSTVRFLIIGTHQQVYRIKSSSK
ncbi:MAG: type II toxin-antitoxin system mRNA interferase toxin, RelE/StbE family [bacterium]|nr:type II toxin-antitoxin system mRNA interferase toxin, RelE/StbE family [bacterium]